MSGTTNIARRGAFAFFLGTAGRLTRRWCSTYSPQTEQATSRSGSSSAPCTAHERGDSYNDAHEDTCAIPDGIVRFHCRLPSFHKTKRAASGVRSEHLMQPKVRPLFGGHAGCGLILGSLLSANGRKYLYKKVPAGKTPRPIRRNAIYYRHRLRK